MERFADYEPLADVYNRHWGGFATRVVPALETLVLSEMEHGGRVLDVCCGTGQLAAALCRRGFDVIGIDGSEAMIAWARVNAPEARFLVVDARRFSLERPVTLAVSTYDSLNHVLSPADLVRVFGCVHRALDDDGLFVFDLNTEEGYLTRWRGSFGIVGENEVIVVRSRFDQERSVGEMELTVMTRDGDSWQRSDSSLVQRCHTQDRVIDALSEAGFGEVEVVDGRELGLADVGRSFFVARKRSA